MTGDRGTFRAIRTNLAGVRAVEAQSRHGFPPHIHDEFGIGRIRHGAQRSRSGRGMVEAGAGDIITCNPGEVHDGHPIGGGRGWTMLYFDPATVAAAVADVREQKTSFEFARPRLRDRRIAARFERLVAAVTCAEAAELWSPDEILLRLFAELERAEGDAPLRFPPQSVARIVRRIDSDPTALVLLSDLASGAGLSAYQLIRGFRSATGLTPHAYILQRRLQLARRLIAGRVPIAEAALSAGFADQAHLTRLFVRTYGLSPAKFAQACG